MPGFEIFGDEERKEVMDVLESGVLMRYGFDGARNGHWKVQELEAALKDRHGSKFAHVCSSGTAALSCALAACGVGVGDEVILPAFTFVADPEVVLLAGAQPVFAEIDETLCLDPRSVEQAITPRTKAVLVVHMCGSMARVDQLAEICSRHGIALIEDVAQAVGATFNGKPLGTFGKCACFSFDYVKTITCGEGGALITNDPEVYRCADAFSDHGHDHRGKDRGADQHPHIGMNFRISELQAAVGIAQLRKLDHILRLQRERKQFFLEGLKDVARVRFRDVPDRAGDSATFFSFLLPTEGEARQAGKDLAQAGVDGCFYWYDNNWHYHRQWDHLKQLKSPGRLAVDTDGPDNPIAQLNLPQSDQVMGRTLSMLIKLSWTSEQMNQRLQAMRSVLS